MESNNDQKSVLDSYLEQNKAEAAGTLNTNTEKLPLASFGSRLGALIVDGLLLWVVNYLFMMPFDRKANGFEGLVLGIVVNFLYAGYFYSTRGATPGKMVFNISVGTVSGQKVSFVTGGLRDSIGKWISGLTLLIGYLLPLFRDDKAALHDLIFKTRVFAKKTV